MTSTTTSVGPAPARPGSRRVLPLTGLGFVICVLLGNSLAETGATGSLDLLAALAASATVRIGLALELVGFVLLLGFVTHVAVRGRRAPATVGATLAGGVALAVKLGSAAALLGAVRERDRLDEATATAMIAINDASFGLFWICFGVFVAAAALALPVGQGWWWAGALLGSLTTLAGVLGSVLPAAAVPVPFLLALLWTAAVSVRLAARPDSVPAQAA